MFAQIYIGCKCKETYRVGVHAEHYNDEYYETIYCLMCDQSNLEEKKENGINCYQVLSHEEIQEDIDLKNNENYDLL